MVVPKQYLQKNLFNLLLSSITAATAANYIYLFYEPKIWEVLLWVGITFVSVYLITYLSVKLLYRLASKRIRIFAYAIYSAVILLSCNFLIFPTMLLFTGPIVEDNRHSICCETPLDFGAPTYESVKFTLEDGTSAHGWYIPATLHKDSLIILIHGHYADRRATREWAKLLVEAGYGIYMYDLRGHGESEGLLDYVHSDLSKDLLNIRGQLAKKYSVEKFGAVGLSMGAHAAVNVLSKEENAFHALWLDGLSPQAPQDLYSFKFGALIYSNLDVITRIIFKNASPKLEPLLEILNKNNTAQIMVVAAGAEELELSVGRKLSSTKNKRNDVWIIPTALHINGISVEQEEYKQRLLSFFQDVLN